MNYIIGVGGVGSWLTPALCLLTRPDRVTVMDGDTLEKKNMNRQLFSDKDIGKNKAAALAAKYGCEFIPEYFTVGRLQLTSEDNLIVCADNNPARLFALQESDREGCSVYVGANETNSSEAYVFHQDWRRTPLDPRIYYPTIVSDRSGDPFARAIGCTGEAQEANVQLVTANMSAASLVAHLFMLWTIKGPKLDREAREYFPYLMRVNMTKSETLRVIDTKPKEERTT